MILARARTQWDRFWYASIDARPFELFRVAVGYVLLAYVLTWAGHAREWLTPAGFHTTRAADPGFGARVPLVPEALLWPVLGTYVAAIVGTIVLAPGRARRAAVVIAWLGLVYVTQLDPISAFTINRVFVVWFLLFALAPDPEPSDDGPRILAWPVRVVQIGLCAMYFLAGWGKATGPDWLYRSDVLWTQVQGVYANELAAWLLAVLPMWAWTVMQWLAFGFELAAPVLLGVKRLRPVGIVLGLGMHVIIAATMEMLWLFSAQLACAYVLFVDPQWLARLRRRPADAHSRQA
jgi:hypothetical protein